MKRERPQVKKFTHNYGNTTKGRRYVTNSKLLKYEIAECANSANPVNIDETLSEVRKKELHPNVYSGSIFFFLKNLIFLCLG